MLLRSGALSLFFAFSLWGCSDQEQASHHHAQQKTLPSLQLASCKIGLYILGNGQDAGKPQISIHTDPSWDQHNSQALASSIALIDNSIRSQQAAHYLFDVSPDIKTQYYNLAKFTGFDQPELSGLFLTHAHIGHYLGLAQIGREAMGAKSIKTYAMPEMASFLRENGPWSQLVTLNNIALHELMADAPVSLSENLSVTPFLVPHRDEYAETVGYKITYKEKSAIYLPDIDSWEQWAELGHKSNKTGPRQSSAIPGRHFLQRR